MKDNICPHCKAVNSHFGFKCHTQRKPIKKRFEVNLKQLLEDNPDAKEFTFQVGSNKPLRDTKTPKPISKQSDKEKKRQVAYMALRKTYMEQHDKCMFKDCNIQSTECHHIRGRGKEYMLDTSEWMAVCSEHHRYIHDNDKECRELGYLKSRLGK